MRPPLALVLLTVAVLGVTPTPRGATCEEQLRQTTAALTDVNVRVRDATATNARVIADYKHIAATAMATTKQAVATAARYHLLSNKASDNAERAVALATYWKKRAEALEADNARLRLRASPVPN